MTRNDEDLVRRTRSGDDVALEALLEQNLPRLRAFVRAKVGARLAQQESCSDLVQSACREVLIALPEFEYRGETEFRSFLFQAALRKIIDRARWHGAQARDAAREQAIGEATGDLALATFLTPSRDLQSREELHRLEAAFDGLPDEYREAIVLRRIVGLSYGEIAADLERTEGAARNLVYRGLARLSELLQE